LGKKLTTLRTVSIIPGMEMAAPLLHEKRRGWVGSPNFRPMSDSIREMAALTSSQTTPGRSSVLWYTWQRGVVRVKPGGTSIPMECISCRPRPFPPRIFLSGFSMDVTLPPKGTRACRSPLPRFVLENVASSCFFPLLLLLLAAVGGSVM